MASNLRGVILSVSNWRRKEVFGQFVTGSKKNLFIKFWCQFASYIVSKMPYFLLQFGAFWQKEGKLVKFKKRNDIRCLG